MSFKETHVQVMAKMNLMMKTNQLFLVLGQILDRPRMYCPFIMN